MGDNRPSKITSGASVILFVQTAGMLYVGAVAGGMLYEMLTDPMYLIFFAVTSAIGFPLYTLYAYSHHAHDGERIFAFIKRYFHEIRAHTANFLTDAVKRKACEILSEYKVAKAKYKNRPVNKD